MIRVKQTELPPSGAHWSYGPDYMRGISRASAAKLCGMYPLPPMGSEIVVAIRPDPVWSTFKKRLSVQNVSGSFFLASTDTRVDAWPSVFGVEVQA